MSQNPRDTPFQDAMTKRWALLWAGAFFLVSFVLFVINLATPRGFSFDEFHYVPAAKKILEYDHVQNWEHPPVGKEIMAIGIGIFGDQPVGWRIMSVLFGAWTLVGMFFLSWAVLEDRKLAVWATLLTLCNHLLFVQARIGMLDTFMCAFLIWGLAGFTFAYRSGFDQKRKLRLLTFAGFNFGLAMGCKWFALMPWAGCFALIFCSDLLLFLNKDKIAKKNAKERRKNKLVSLEPESRVVSSPLFWIGFGVLPVVTYLMTFVPLLFAANSQYRLHDLIRLQYDMWGSQLRVVNPHPYMSNWPSWPLMLRPIWYAFESEGINREFVRGVLLVGNPWIMWSGLLMLLFCFWDAFKNKARASFLTASFYIMLYFSWALIPRKISFYYYYYPAGMILSLCAACFFLRSKTAEKLQWLKWVYLWVAVFIFVYFYPILSGMKIRSASFTQWTWFSNSVANWI